MAFSIGNENGEITGIEDIPAGNDKGLRVYAHNGNIIIEAAKAGSVSIYSIDSRLMRTVQVEEGVNTVGGLVRGFYIVEKQKVLLK